MPREPRGGQANGSLAIFGVGESVVCSRENLERLGFVGPLVQRPGVRRGDQLVPLPMDDQAMGEAGRGLGEGSHCEFLEERGPDP